MKLSSLQVPLTSLAGATLPVVAAMWWVFNNVVLSEDLVTFQKQTNYKIDSLGVSLRIEDIEYKLFALRLIPVLERNDYERALIGKLADDLTKWQARETTLNKADED